MIENNLESSKSYKFKDRESKFIFFPSTSSIQNTRTSYDSLLLHSIATWLYEPKLNPTHAKDIWKIRIKGRVKLENALIRDL